MTQDDPKEHLVLPTYSVDLIAALDREYPPRCISRGETPEEAHRYAGMRELIDELVAWRDETEEAERARVAGEKDQDRGRPE